MSGAVSPGHDAPRAQWLERARFLAYFTVGYNLVEGLVSMSFGWADESFALFGFGADSFIEVGSALVVLWRLKGEGAEGCATQRLARERQAALAIGVLFLLLALGTAIGAALQLASLKTPYTTVPGLVVSVVSLGFMFGLWRAKLRAARALDSRTLEGDAACSLACIQLSTVLFTGSLLFLVVPALWWVDGVAALVLAGFIGKEGVQGIRGALKKDFTGGCGCH